MRGYARWGSVLIAWRESVYVVEVGAAVFSMIETFFATRRCLELLRPDPAAAARDLRHEP